MLHIEWCQACQCIKHIVFISGWAEIRCSVSTGRTIFCILKKGSPFQISESQHLHNPSANKTPSDCPCSTRAQATLWDTQAWRSHQLSIVHVHQSLLTVQVRVSFWVASTLCVHVWCAWAMGGVTGGMCGYIVCVCTCLLVWICSCVYISVCAYNVVIQYNSTCYTYTHTERHVLLCTPACLSQVH